MGCARNPGVGFGIGVGSVLKPSLVQVRCYTIDCVLLRSLLDKWIDLTDVGLWLAGERSELSRRGSLTRVMGPQCISVPTMIGWTGRLLRGRYTQRGECALRRCWRSTRGLQYAVARGQRCRGVEYHWLRESAGLLKEGEAGRDSVACLDLRQSWRSYWLYGGHTVDSAGGR